MSESIAKKYADWLRGSDIVDLFESLEKAHGSVSKAAKACGLERKTVYDWKRRASAENLKAATKRKVVAALLEQVPEETLDSIIERLLSQVRELLHVYLSTLYEHAVEEKDPREFAQLVKHFGDALTKYGGLVAGRSEIETSTMLRELSARSDRLAEPITIPPIMVYSSEQLERLLPLALTQVRTTHAEDSEQIEQIARRLRMTPAIVRGLASNVGVREELGVDVKLTTIRPSELRSIDRLWYEGVALTKYESLIHKFDVRDTFEELTKAVGATQVLTS